ncbi:2'-5' RNA ligase family protein [Streptomyces sp. NPDC003032]
MDTFFTPEKLWPGGGPYPHFLVLLEKMPAYRSYARAHASFLAGFPHLSVVPEEWLHATVQGIHHPVTDTQLKQLRAAAAARLETMRPFTVQLGPVWPGVTAVTVAVYPEEGMTDLNDRVRAACETVPGIGLRPRESRFWPHTTLAYARHDSCDDRLLNRGLRALRPERVTLTVDRVHLVSQRQDPHRGYTWDVIEEFVLPAGGRMDA